MVLRLWTFGTSRRVLGTWAAITTILLLWLAAHVMLWLIATPTYSVNCTQRMQGIAAGHVETSAFGEPRWDVDACTMRDGRVLAGISLNPVTDEVRVTGMAGTSGSSLAGLTPVLEYGDGNPDGEQPSWLTALDAITPWATVPYDSLGGQMTRRVGAAEVSADGATATFRVPGLVDSARSFVYVRWLSPAAARDLLERGASTTEARGGS